MREGRRPLSRLGGAERARRTRRRRQEVRRAIANGALGAQIYTNVVGRPLDDPEFEPFFAAMNEIGKPIWLHPARTAAMSDYATETKSKYEIWWTFGWSYETADRKSVV